MSSHLPPTNETYDSGAKENLIQKSIIADSELPVAYLNEKYNPNDESWAGPDITLSKSEPYHLRCKLSTGLDSEIAKRHLPVE